MSSQFKTCTKNSDKLILQRIAALRDARNPHVLNCTFWFLRFVRLALHLNNEFIEKLE